MKQAETAPPRRSSPLLAGEHSASRHCASLAGLGLIALAAVLYSRKGYGRFGDPAQRSKPCTVSRCAHNARAALVAGLVALGLPRAKRYRQEGV